MEHITISDLLKATNGTLLVGSETEKINHVSTNSSDIKNNTLFVPIIGEKVDAHSFINDSFFNGAIATLTSKSEICNNKKNWILVNDTKLALQQIAFYYRSKFSIPIIGITGSVGKTTTKEIVASALSFNKNILKTSGNQNSQIGLPLTIFNIEKHHDIAVLEMGMSQFGEMKKLADISKPDIAIITNIGISHIESLKSQKNIFSEKIHIADYVKQKGKLYLNGDDEILYSESKNLNITPTLFGLSEHCNWRAHSIKTYEDFSEFVLVTPKNEEYIFKIPAIGIHNIYNTLAAIAVAHDLGFSFENIQKGLNSYKTPDMRQNVHKLKNRITLIDDSYNASPDSIKSGISVLNSISKDGRKIAVLADMLELGDYSKQEHFNLGKFCAEAFIDILITIGNEAKQIALGAESINDKIITYTFDNNQQAIDKLNLILKDNDTLLVKGSRCMKTDVIVKNIIKNFS